jgi:hypothetical protein
MSFQRLFAVLPLAALPGAAAPADRGGHSSAPVAYRDGIAARGHAGIANAGGHALRSVLPPIPFYRLQ